MNLIPLPFLQSPEPNSCINRLCRCVEAAGVRVRKLARTSPWRLILGIAQTSRASGASKELTLGPVGEAGAPCLVAVPRSTLCGPISLSCRRFEANAEPIAAVQSHLSHFCIGWASGITARNSPGAWRSGRRRHTGARRSPAEAPAVGR